MEWIGERGSLTRRFRRSRRQRPTIRRWNWVGKTRPCRRRLSIRRRVVRRAGPTRWLDLCCHHSSVTWSGGITLVAALNHAQATSGE